VSSFIYSPSESPLSSKFPTLVVLAPPLLSQITQVTASASGSSQTKSRQEQPSHGGSIGVLSHFLTISLPDSLAQH